MARDLILHIGTSKTGSTSIQRVLSRQRREMLAQGVVYPRSPGFERHGYLPMAAATDRKRVDDSGKLLWKGVTPEARLAKFREEFDHELRTLPDNVHRIIISAEQFSMVLLDRQSVQNLYDMLSPHADRMTVVVWLRRPDQHYTSLYSQMMRWGDAQPPGLAHAKVTPAHGYDFDGLLDRWASVFGESAMKPLIFERVRGQKFDVVEDFLTICGLQLTPSVMSATELAAANQALSYEAQAALYTLAMRMRAGKRGNVSSLLWTNLVEAASAALPGRSWQPTRTEAAEFVARWADNHEAVRRRWFPDRQSLFSQNFSDLPERSLELDDDAMARILPTLAQALAENLGRKMVARKSRAPTESPVETEQASPERQDDAVVPSDAISMTGEAEPRRRLARLLQETPAIDSILVAEVSQILTLALARKAVMLDDEIAADEAAAAEHAGDDERLHRILSKRVMIEPTDVELRMKLAHLLQRTHDLIGARRQVDQVLKIDPAHEQALSLAESLPPDPSPPPAKRPGRGKAVHPDQTIRFS